VTTRGVTLAALLAALSRPSWWLLALAGFLVRGGVLLFVVAIVMLPSPLVLSNVLEPVIVPIDLGGANLVNVAPLLAAGGVLIAGLLVGSWIGAATEVALIREARLAMADDGMTARPAIDGQPGGQRLTGRVATTHLLAHLPTALALGLGSIRVVSVAYLELTSPFEVATPLVVRVVLGAAGPIAAVVLVWLFGEIVGGIAARRIVLDDEPVLGGLRTAVRDLVRRPFSVALPALTTTLVLAVDLAAVLAIVAFAWAEVRDRLLESTIDGAALIVALLAFVATWIAALALTGLIAAWRSAAMSFEAERAGAERRHETAAAPDPGGTIGASPGRRPGDWSTGDRGGSL